MTVRYNRTYGTYGHTYLGTLLFKIISHIIDAFNTENISHCFNARVLVGHMNILWISIVSCLPLLATHRKDPIHSKIDQHKFNGLQLLQEKAKAIIVHTTINTKHISTIHK